MIYSFIYIIIFALYIGTNDETINYNGGNLLAQAGPIVLSNNPYPSSQQTFDKWVQNNQCDTNSNNIIVRDNSFSLVSKTFNDVSTIAYTKCNGNVRVEKWKIQDATHAPNWAKSLFDQVYSFIMTQSKSTGPSKKFIITYACILVSHKNTYDMCECTF